MIEEADLIVQDGLPSSVTKINQDEDELTVTEVESELSVNAKITYFKDRPFKGGSGNSGSSILIYEGFFNGTIPIALKRYQNVNKQLVQGAKRDVEALSSEDNRHPNFIRYFGHIEDPYYTYIVIELCECSVADIIDPNLKNVAHKKTPYFTDILMNLSHKEILKQSSEAVCFLHDRNKIHRNLHPENFLIACVDPVNKDHFLIKLTDFQFTKNIKIQPKNTRPNPKDGWVAPESYPNNKDDELTIKFDSFLLGCYYFYVLSGGFHPFGEEAAVQEGRIGCDQDRVYKEDWDGGPKWPMRSTPFHKFAFYQEETGWALTMIKDLIKYKATERKSVEQILESKYFVPESYVIYENSTSPRPGLCVIVSQEIHYNPANDLDCVEDYSHVSYKIVGLDAETLEDTFVKLGYDILRFKNLRTRELETMLTPEELVKRDEGVEPFSKYASLIICYLGHGNPGSVCGVDGGNVSLNRIQFDAFGDERCPELSGKPKIFIILACQGDKRQQMISEKNDNITSSSMMATTLRGFNSSPSTNYGNRPILYDFIRLSSTIEEYKSYSYDDHGSTFIQSLCSALSNEYRDVNPPRSKERRKRDLTQLFTDFVTPSVGLSGGKFKQTPEFRSSLSKAIRFQSRKPSDFGKLLNNGDYDGENMDSEAFRTARKKWEDKGFKKKKRISNEDYTFLLATILGEADGESNEVQQAIAWVILNRYNSNKDEWGGNKSLKDVCNCEKFKKDWTTLESHLKLEAGSTKSILNWIPPELYESSKDPTKGATYFKKLGNNEAIIIPENCRKTKKIGSYQFYKDGNNCNIS